MFCQNSQISRELLHFSAEILRDRPMRSAIWKDNQVNEPSLQACLLLPHISSRHS